MKQLFKADFARDSFCNFIATFVRDENTARLVMLAYRLARYAQLNKYGEEYSDRPKIAVKIFLDLTKKTFKRSYTYAKPEVELIAILLSYVIRNSRLLTQEDVIKIFGQTIDKKVGLLMGLERIINSRAKITPAKQVKFKEDIPKRIMIMRAAITIAELRDLTLVKAKSFPIRVHERHLPVYEAYPDVAEQVAVELKKWLIKKLKEAQSSEDYNLTKGDMFGYFSILNDSNKTI